MAVSYDDVSILSDFAERKGITYPLLFDAESSTIRAFGIHHQDGYPHPGTFLIGRDGVVRAKLFLEGYRQRHDLDALLEAAHAAGLISAP